MAKDYFEAVATKVRLRPIPARRLVSGQHIQRRTAIANGRSVLPPEGDGNSWWGRRFAELVALHLDDLGGGDLCSEAQVSLAKRAAALSVALEAREADWSAGRPVDLAEYGTAVGQLARVLNAIGLKRIARVIGPTDIHAYARMVNGGEA